MRKTLPVPIIALLLLNVGLLKTQGEVHLQTLQGEWTVAAAEQRGRPFDVIVGGVLTVTEDRFALLTATGNEFQGQIRIDATQSPGHLDFVHDDGLPVGGDLRGAAGLLPSQPTSKRTQAPRARPYSSPRRILPAR